jgi:hypothetical protein
VAVLVAALLLSALLQRYAFSYRTGAINRNRPEGTPAASRVANLDSFSLALLLGGLRGPLVMFLWTNSETQKSEKDLEGFDTQVELIRLLQPEFDSVHLFQIWNKAYNISVQMASLSNKYAAILDALRYARDVDRTNPNNINIVSATGGLLTDKLGNSQEKGYYIRRVRTETLPLYKVTVPAGQAEAFRGAVAAAGVEEGRVRFLPAAGGDGSVVATMEKATADRVLAAYKGPGLTIAAVPRQDLRPDAAATNRPYEMDTVLDERGYILPQYLKPLVDVPPGAERNDGSELQYLKPFQPFPYGLSPIAMGYNYHKRAQILHRVGRQKHLHHSELVTDNQPGLQLKQWAEEERERGRRLEQRAFGITPEETDKALREAKAADLAAGATVVDRAALDEAIFSYRRAAQVARAALPEMATHVKNFPSNLSNYRSHQAELEAVAHLMAADAKYLEGLLPGASQSARAEAKAAYEAAMRAFAALAMRFYIDDADAKQAGYARTDAFDQPLADLDRLFLKAVDVLEKKYGPTTPNLPELQEYAQTLKRVRQRLTLLK